LKKHPSIIADLNTGNSMSHWIIKAKSVLLSSLKKLIHVKRTHLLNTKPAL